MIYIKNLSNGKLDQVFPITFPDGTSQVWKLDIDSYRDKNVQIVWYFEQEAELIWVNQLSCLLNQENVNIVELYMPFLPYGRQDKEVSNTSTFARVVFLEMLLTEMVGRVTTLDIHSRHPKVFSYSPVPYIKRAIEEFKPDAIVFPDAGAYNRYSQPFSDRLTMLELAKTRNQLTGEITGMRFADIDFIPHDYNSKKTRLLIVDDICDGGATFNNASMFLHTAAKEQGLTAEIGLYVTHGLFSKGFEKMIDSGITSFYTTQSIIRNVDGFKLEEV